MIGLALTLLALQAAEPAPAPAPPAAPPRMRESTSPAGTLISGVLVSNKRGGNSDVRFCRDEAPMGTRIPVKRCYNKQEFKSRQSEEQRVLDRMQANVRVPGG